MLVLKEIKKIMKLAGFGVQVGAFLIENLTQINAEKLATKKHKRSDTDFADFAVKSGFN